MPIKHKPDITHNAGFTLLEVLIAVFVLATGLLGLAGLQAATLSNNQSAYNRSQATRLAYDMAERIRSNFVVAKNLQNSTYITINPDAATDQKDDCAAVSTTCTASDMAQNDLFLWYQDLTNTLPSGTGSIAVNAATRVFTITINWDDNRDGLVNSSDPNFQMSLHL
jgi:type IV pilus assembly protein PilV